MDYTEMLKQEFLDRKQRRPAYSERAFARDLKVSPGYVSLLFRGRRALSPAKGIEIARRIGWTEEKTNLFVGSIQRRSLEAVSLSPAGPKAKAVKFSELEMDKFRFIADLNHLAALTLIQSREGLDARKVAKLLSLSDVEAELLTGRLLRLGLVRSEKNKLKSTKKSLEIKEVPSDAIRSFHRQAIRKAEASIEEQSIEMRNLAALSLSFSPGQMAEAKAFINRFLKSFEKKFGHTTDGEIYQMNTQFFRLSREEK